MDTGVILSNNWFIEIYKAVKKIDGVVWYGDSSEAANPEYVIAKCNEIIYREDLDRRMKHSSYFITRAPKTSNCLFTRKILEEVNGFDTNLNSNEDVEIGYRIWMKGKKIVYIPNAKSKNMHRTQIRSKMKRRWEEGKSLAYNKRKHEKYPINWSMYVLLPYSCFKRFFTWG